MPRFALILLLSTHAALTAGDVAGTELGVCFERCPDDDAQGNCAATCADCAACPHAQTSAVQSAVKDIAAVGSDPIPEAAGLVPPTPEPAEILHVPKAVLA